MGRRKNNPDLVNELIDGLWTMDDAEFEEKYNSLSSSDMDTVIDAIHGMEDEWMSRMKMMRTTMKKLCLLMMQR